MIDEGRIQKLLVKDLDLEDGGEYKMTKGQIVSKAIINVKGNKEGTALVFPTLPLIQ